MTCLSNCNTCDNKQHPDGGWCYMFRHEPDGICAKHKPVRKPLTDEHILDMAEGCTAQYHDLLDFARAIEAAHGIKGDA